MSIFSWLKDRIDVDVARSDPWLDAVFSGSADVRHLLTEAEKWMPPGEWYDYTTEMTNRIAYYRRSMQHDMRSRLQSWFTETYKEIEARQFNLPILSDTIRRKAQVFSNPGKLYLVDQQGNRVESGPAADRFQDMLDRGQFTTALQDIDGYTQLCARAMMVLQWDPRNERVKPSIWTSNVVRIVPNEFLHWDFDSAYVIMLQIPGSDGVSNTDKRWMVYAKRLTDQGWQSRHYIAGSRARQDETGKVIRDKKSGNMVIDWYRRSINSGDILPFRDWAHDNEPMYPMYWWQADTDAELFKLDDEDMLTPNRMINSVLTDMMHNIHLNAWGEEVYHTPAGEGVDIQAVIPGMRVSGPGHPEELPPGVDKQYIAPDLPLKEVTDILMLLTDLDGRLRGLPSTVASEIKTAQGLSGIALKIRDLPLTRHIKKMQEVYAPQVCETLRRAIIVHDTYATDKIGEYNVGWEPGDFEEISDAEAKTRRDMLLISKDVKTPIDLYMEEHDEPDVEAATKAVLDNAELNASISAVHTPLGLPDLTPETPANEPPQEPEPPTAGDEG